MLIALLLFRLYYIHTILSSFSLRFFLDLLKLQMSIIPTLDEIRKQINDLMLDSIMVRIFCFSLYKTF